MGLLEYLFERKNPGNVGDIERNKPPVEPTEPAEILLIIIKLIISVALIYGLFYVTVLQNFSVGNTLIFLVILSIYCIVSYNFVPRPDTSNMGLLGGLIDHPFRYTDDANRFLLFLFIILYPGRFIATTLVQIFKLIINSRR